MNSQAEGTKNPNAWFFYLGGTMETKSKTRKVIKLGDALVIVLPKEFTDKADIKKGDTVGITYNSVLVMVTPHLPKEKENEENR